MSSSDSPTPSPAHSTPSPDELRAELERARERLSFYESFDRIIAENVKRTGEMMTETVELREKAAAEARERARTEDAHATERARYERVIADALSDVANLRSALDGITNTLTQLLPRDASDRDDNSVERTTEVDQTPSDDPAERLFSGDAAPEEAISLTEVDPLMHHVTSLEPTIAEEGLVLDPATSVQHAADAPNADPRQSDDTSKADEQTHDTLTALSDPALIDIVAHGAPFNIASELQMLLRGLDPVTDVQVKQFVNGEMRLVVHASGALPVDDITSWVTRHNGTLTSHRDSVIEVTFG